MSTIQVKANQVSSEDAYTECNWKQEVCEISDSCAVTIASWWQSSGDIGHTLASFASGCEVDRTDLLDDIAATRRIEKRMSVEDNLALDMLSTFVINYGK